MLLNNQIHSSFTNVPGHDGQISYGGLCFPKDTNALNKFMIKNKIPNSLMNACINERNSMRDDHDNCKM
jgi:UDP-glucose 6-dehydrogenase